MSSISYYTMKRLHKYHNDQGGGANCGEEGYGCVINPKTKKHCRAEMGEDGDMDNCVCLLTKSGYRCKKKKSNTPSAKGIGERDTSPPKEKRGRDRSKRVRGSSTKLGKKDKKDKKDKEDKEDKDKKDKDKEGELPKPNLKRAASNENTSAWERVLSEYRKLNKPIDTFEERQNAFLRYLVLMRQPRHFYAGNAEIAALDYYVIHGGIMNNNNGNPRPHNIYIYYNGQNHYEVFRAIDGSVAREGDEVFGRVEGVAGDGDCFYNSVLRGLKSTRWGNADLNLRNINTAEGLRSLAIEIMDIYKDHYMNFFYPEG